MWVSIALSHCLRELEIARGSDSAKPVILPSDLFTCKSLVVLKLVGVILLDVPRILVSLPSLKTLKLQSLKYFNEETLQRLLSNCPILEDLVVDLRDGDTTGKLTVVVPSLLSFSLYIPYYHHIDGYVIETPSLKYFKLRDHHRNDDHYCLIENMPHLVEAYLDVNLTDIKSLIGSITSVKHLEICSLTMLDEGFVFNQLEHLDLCLCPKHSSNNQLVRLLKSSPNLQGLHLFFVKYGHCFEFMGEWNQPTTVPECISSSLQSLSWSLYRGKPQEREIVVYILKHALHLKTATIKSSQSSGVPESEMLKELELSPRASAAVADPAIKLTCVIIFCFKKDHNKKRNIEHRT